MYQIQMQFIPGSDSIWVAKLEAHHELHEHQEFEVLQAKLEKLQSADTSGRVYRIVYL